MTPSTPSSRRDFLRTSAGGATAGWVLLNLPLLSTLSACARDAAGRGEPLRSFSPAEGRTLEALVARLIPSEEGSPGAVEAGAAHFVDAAVEGPFAALAEPVKAGLAELDRLALDAHGAPLDELTNPQRDAVVGQLEEGSPNLFFPLRMLTVMGVMADPSWGGNRDGIGWAMLGMEHAGAHQPPFGHYDAEAATDGEGDAA